MTSCERRGETSSTDLKAQRFGMPTARGSRENFLGFDSRALQPSKSFFELFINASFLPASAPRLSEIANQRRYACQPTRIHDPWPRFLVSLV
jgi:hypothetical protein